MSRQGSPPLRDVSSPGRHALWYLESQNGERATCTLIVSPDSFDLHVEVTGRPAYQQTSWNLTESLVLAADLNDMLRRLGWRESRD